METIKVVIIEDDLIIAAHISKVLETAGVNILEVFTKGESAINFLQSNTAHVILMDINLAGDLDGIDTAKIIGEKYNYPIVFLSGNSDKPTFERSKEAAPHAFITKPFKNEELVRTVELVYNRNVYPAEPKSNSEMFTLNDRVFVRDKNKMKKLHFEDILYVEAERNYCNVITKLKSYVLSVPLAKFEQKVSSKIFQRIHRSHLVNITAIDELDDNYVFINGKSLTISKSFKSELTKKLTLI